MHADGNRLKRLSSGIIGCAFAVLDTLGNGLLAKAYENGLAPALRKTGLAVARQRGVTVTCDDTVVGGYFVGLLVALKTVKALDEAHRAQCVTYLVATGLPRHLLLDFAKPRPDIKRAVNRL